MSSFQDAMIERYNYENDSRVRAARAGQWYSSFDESRMTVEVVLYSDETDDEEEHELPVRFGVCPTCDGRGSHVNPSIDAGGISPEDFDEDPDFAEAYFGGAYDVSCYECKGKRVVPEINLDACTEAQKAIVKRLQEKWAEDAEYEAMCRAERMMGA